MRISVGTANFFKEAIGWLIISLVAFGSVYYFTDIRALSRSFVGPPAETAEIAESPPRQVPARPAASASFSGEVHLRAADNGHFFSSADINGRSVNVVLDTGATGVALTYEDARDIGFRLDDSEFTMQSQTANGTARIAPVMLDRVQIGDIEVRDVEAYVAEKGKLFQTLLGMSFLRKLSHIDIRGGELVLTQ